jgi:hypothetical protein
VDVGFEHVRDPQVALMGERLIHVHVAPGVDDGDDPALSQPTT